MAQNIFIKNPKLTGEIKQRNRFRLDARKNIFQELYDFFYTDLVVNTEQVEIRSLLGKCRGFWNKLIDKHHMITTNSLLE